MEEKGNVATEQDVSQVGETPVTSETDAETAQSKELLPGETQPEATTAPVEVLAPETPPAGKTYTEAELTQITSRLQADAAQHKQYAQRLAFEQQMAQVQAQEQQFVAKDAQAVEQGIITQEEADQKKAARAEIAQLQYAAQYQRAQAEESARVIVIDGLLKGFERDFGMKLNPDDFLGDKQLRTPDAVKQKALTIINTQLKAQLKAATVKTEHFDQGPGAGVPGPTSEQQKLKDRYPTMFSKQ